MTTRTPLPTDPAPAAAGHNSGRRRAPRFFRHYDDPPGVDSHALPSELALRPIEPHYPMHR